MNVFIFSMLHIKIINTYNKLKFWKFELFENLSGVWAITPFTIIRQSSEPAKVEFIYYTLVVWCSRNARENV